MEYISFEHNNIAAELVKQAYDTPPLAFVHSYGCQQNVNDGERIKGVLMDIGYGLCDKPEDADLILFNTCAVREHAEQRVFVAADVPVVRTTGEETSMNYAAIKTCDIANGPGVRTSLFVSGCTHHCKGCFQPETWDFSYGEPFTQDVIDTILHSLEPAYVAGLTLLGGEPFEPANQPAVAELLRQLRARCPGKNVWAFTGFLLDRDLLSGRVGDAALVRQMLGCIDVLVDGPFVLEKKDLALRFRGSSHQRLIDIPATLASGRIVLWDDGYQRGGHYDAKGTR